jgi:hypothetical protein
VYKGATNIKIMIFMHIDNKEFARTDLGKRLSPWEVEFRCSVLGGGEGDSKEGFILVEGSARAGEYAADGIVDYLNRLSHGVPFFIQGGVPEDVNYLFGLGTARQGVVWNKYGDSNIRGVEVTIVQEAFEASENIVKGGPICWGPNDNVLYGGYRWDPGESCFKQSIKIAEGVFTCGGVSGHTFGNIASEITGADMLKVIVVNGGDSREVGKTEHGAMCVEN